jgi:prefoldin subunit 5
MVAAVTSVGSGSAAGGKSINAQVAALQKQFGAMQKQMVGLQKQLTETTNAETRKAIQLQLDAVSAQMQMIQQQIAMLRSQGGAADAMKKDVPALEGAKAAAEAGGKQRDLMMGSLVDTQA